MANKARKIQCQFWNHRKYREKKYLKKVINCRKVGVSLLLLLIAKRFGKLLFLIALFRLFNVFESSLKIMCLTNRQKKSVESPSVSSVYFFQMDEPVSPWPCSGFSSVPWRLQLIYRRCRCHRRQLICGNSDNGDNLSPVTRPCQQHRRWNTCYKISLPTPESEH
jgi:hypothetical protein